MRYIRSLTFGTAAALACVASGALFAAERTVPPAADNFNRDFRGVWLMEGGGAWPAFPYKGEYREIYVKRLEAAENGIPFKDPAGQCITSGMPRAIAVGGYPWEITQTQSQITMLKENLNSVRRIFIGRKEHDLSNGPTYWGDSIAHWEGDTLVIDTAGVRGDTLFDPNAPHSPEARWTERVTKVDAETIEWELSVDDPVAFSRPISTTMIYKLKPDWTLAEYVCDNPRNSYDSQGNPVITDSTDAAKAVISTTAK